MKTLVCIGLFLALMTFPIAGMAQSPVVEKLQTDTLPPIQIKKNIPLLLLSIYTSYYLLVNANYYKVGNRTYYSTAPLKSFLSAPGDSVIIDLYQKHRSNRVVWFATTSAGTLIFSYGFIAGIASVFGGSDGSSAGGYLMLGGALAAVGVITRIISFKQLRQAVKIYNNAYAQKPKLSFSVQPASSGVGVGLVAKF